MNQDAFTAGGSLHFTRRRALRLLAGSAAAPFILPGRLPGSEAPSETVTLGVIGIGWQGTINLQNFLRIPQCRVVAVCDVEQVHLEKAAEMVNTRYGNKDCKVYRDFREILAREDIDAVAISTPDHWHAVQAIAAAHAGKHIFCEKPLSHDLNEGIRMVEEVTKRKIVWQTGSWQRSQGRFRWAAQVVQNGYLGKVSRVEVGLPGGHKDFQKTGNQQPDSAPPAGLDYNMWLGPAREVPYNVCRVHKNWRWNSNTGGGQLLDWVGHHLDIAHWGLANSEFGCGPDDAVGPTEVSANADFPDENAVWNTATKFRVDCRYPANVEVVIAGGHADIPDGTKWIGPDGWMQVSRSTIAASNMAWIREIQRLEKEGKLRHQLPVSPGHWLEFIQCVKSGKRTLTPVEVAHRSQTPGHLGTIAARLGRKIVWDAVKQEIIGDPEATAMMGRKPRAPWSIDGKA
jgi:predicted dehydrogenase